MVKRVELPERVYNSWYAYAFLVTTLSAYKKILIQQLFHCKRCLQLQRLWLQIHNQSPYSLTLQITSWSTIMENLNEVNDPQGAKEKSFASFPEPSNQLVAGEAPLNELRLLM